jgi:hypothetical protein
MKFKTTEKLKPVPFEMYALVLSRAVARAEHAEAREKALREALENIRHTHRPDTIAGTIARAALAKIQPVVEG